MTTGQTIIGYNYEDYIPSENLICPICNTQTPSLDDLNRHLDTQHSEEDSKGALLYWLRHTQNKIQSSLTTSDALKQWMNVDAIGQSIQNSSFFVSENNTQSEADAEFVRRDHWQVETEHDMCSISDCKKVTGGAVGKQHCRKCGKLFCDAHTQYEMRLNRLAQHDPERGVWCKVCLDCYIQRADYLDQQGITRNRTNLFLKLREKTIDRVYLERNRLEKRLEKLAKVHSSSDKKKRHELSPHSLSPSSASISSFGSLLSLDRVDSNSSKEDSMSLSPKLSFMPAAGHSILNMKLKYRDGEQSVTKWADDKNVTQCPFCEKSFTMFNRKHHCRLCGKVVCGNTQCSKLIPLYIDMSSDTFDDVPVGETRACKECQSIVFRRKIKNEEASKPLPIFQLYHQLSLTRNSIEKQLPKFHEIILMLESQHVKSHSQDTFKKAAAIRKSLLDNFALYDTLAKSIKALPAQTPSMRRLQSNICSAANMYLQQNMLPLQMLPRILKPSSKKKKVSVHPEHQTLVSQLEAFTEQFGFVESFIEEAKKDRRYDDVRTLQMSLDELDAEIQRIRNKLDL
ncbi:FYVE-domain-containing protein [Backusella circina FSU 941]|nr:FYVE-domain-containing protein [Backusella circina FSU 941]